MSLPSCYIQYPRCGACAGETDFDGDRFFCDDCGLDYGHGDDYTEAQFLDEEAVPCAEPCNNAWHGKDQLDLTCTPCRLPKGHTSMHWTECQ